MDSINLNGANNIEDKLIHANTNEYLLHIINRIKKAKDGNSLQLLLQQMSTIGLPIYAAFKQEIEDIIATGNSDPHYFHLIKSEVIYTISLAMKIISKERGKFEKEIIKAKIDVEKESAKAPIKF